jgi:uncharacterized membrane protein
MRGPVARYRNHAHFCRMLYAPRLLLILAGLLDTAYLSVEYIFPAEPLVCVHGGRGCDVTRASPYAYVHGVPLPILGFVMYGALAIFLWGAKLHPTFRHLPLILSGAGFAVSLWLTTIEATVLHAWCLWCLVSALVITAIFVLCILDLAVELARKTRYHQRAG